MGRMRLATIRMKRDGYFGDTLSKQAGLDDHLRRKLHPGASQVEPVIELFREAPKATVDVVDRAGVEPPPNNGGQYWVAEPAVKKGHGPGQDPPASSRQA